MAYGLSGIVTILSSLFKRKRIEKLTLSEWPNMPFLYLLAVVGAALKPKWTSSKQFPALEVSMSTPVAPDPSRLRAFKRLADWPSSSSGSEAVPMMFLMAEAFRLVMALITLPTFPVSILGTVVNKRAKYSLVRVVGAGEGLTYSCKLNPTVRETFSGHAEFDLLLTAVSAERGDVVWQAVLSLVLMRPKKKGGGGGAKAAAAKEAPAAGEAIDTWVLAGDTGRRYAALDGDISPMHLYKATAMLMGFPAPVANVHFLAGRTEAALATKRGSAGLLLPPFSLEVEFKKPTLLPNRLTLEGLPPGQDWGAAAASSAGFGLRLVDKKGAAIFVGAAKTHAKAVQVDDLAAATAQ